MRKSLFIFFSFFLTVCAFSEEDFYQVPSPAVSALDQLPDTLLFNCIDAASGTYVDHNVDLLVSGAEPLYLRRFFTGIRAQNFDSRPLMFNRHVLDELGRNRSINHPYQVLAQDGLIRFP